MNTPTKTIGLLSNDEIKSIPTLTPIPHSKKTSSIFIEDSPRTNSLLQRTPTKTKLPLSTPDRSFATPKKKTKTRPESTESKQLKSSKSLLFSASPPENRFYTRKKHTRVDIDEGFQDIGEKLQFLAQNNRSAHQKYRSEIEGLSLKLKTKTSAIEEIKNRQKFFIDEKNALEEKINNLRNDKNAEVRALKERIKSMKSEKLSLQKLYKEHTEKADYSGMNELNKKLLAKSRQLNKTEKKLLSTNKKLVELIKSLSGKISTVNHSMTEDERGLRVLEKSKTNLAERKTNLTAEIDKIESYLKSEDRRSEEKPVRFGGGKGQEDRVLLGRCDDGIFKAYQSGMKMVSNMLGIGQTGKLEMIRDIENSFYRIFEAISTERIPKTTQNRYLGDSKYLEHIAKPEKNAKQTKQTLKILRALKEENERLNMELIEGAREREKMRQDSLLEVAKLSDKLYEKERKCDDLEKRVSTRGDSLFEKREDFAKVERLEKENRLLKERVGKLESEAKDGKILEKMEKLRIENTDLSVKIKEKGLQIEQLEIKSSEAQTEKTYLKNTNKSLEKNLLETKNKLETGIREKAELEMKVRKLKEMQNATKAKFDAKNKVSNDQTKTMSALRSKIEQLSSENKRTTRKLSESEKRLQNAETSAKISHSEAKSLLEKVKSLKNAISASNNSLKSENAKLQIRLESSEALSKNRLSRLESYEQKLAQSSTRLKAHSAEIEHLKSVQTTLRKRLEKERASFSGKMGLAAELRGIFGETPNSAAASAFEKRKNK